jgi:hypothetical protein
VAGGDPTIFYLHGDWRLAEDEAWGQDLTGDHSGRGAKAASGSEPDQSWPQ